MVRTTHIDNEVIVSEKPSLLVMQQRLPPLKNRILKSYIAKLSFAVATIARNTKSYVEYKPLCCLL